MRKFKFKLLSFILTFVLFAGNISSVIAEAAVNNTVSQESSVKELTVLEITDLDEPSAGKPLDTSAVVKSAEGVEWEIPVVWIDENGKVATVAEAGKKYIPNFAFYVPEGYTVKGISATGSLSVKLPAFLGSYGLGNLIFASDPSNGLTYITWNVSKIIGFNYAPNDTSHESEKDEDDKHDDNDDPDPFRDVKIHCSQASIEYIGYDTLAELVRLIKNEIEPRAVAALLEAFPAFRVAAENGEISSELGLYIADSRTDSDMSPSFNAAYSCAFNSNIIFMSRFSANTNYVISQNSAGEYELSKTNMMDLDGFITHEMMHAMMYDYTRTGMMSKDNPILYPDNEIGIHEYNKYPKWFMEGTATTVTHAYEYYIPDFERLSCNNKNIVNSRQECSPLYEEWVLTNCFNDPEMSIKRYRTDWGGDFYGAYLGGYLAVVYLSTLMESNDTSGVPGIPDNELVKSGLNTILEKLHNGTSLDTIIKETGRYEGLIDFENKFCASGDTSTTFSNNFLNYLDSLSTDRRANGSILLPFDTDKYDLLEGRTETSDGQKVLKVADTKEYVISDVDPDSALKSAGSYHTYDEQLDWYTSSPNSAQKAACIVSESNISFAPEDNEEHNNDSGSESSGEAPAVTPENNNIDNTDNTDNTDIIDNSDKIENDENISNNSNFDYTNNIENTSLREEANPPADTVTNDSVSTETTDTSTSTPEIGESDTSTAENDDPSDENDDSNSD